LWVAPVEAHAAVRTASAIKEGRLIVVAKLSNRPRGHELLLSAPTVIPSGARDPRRPERGPSVGSLRIPRLSARDDTLFRPSSVARRPSSVAGSRPSPVVRHSPTRPAAASRPPVARDGTRYGQPRAGSRECTSGRRRAGSSRTGQSTHPRPALPLPRDPHETR